MFGRALKIILVILIFSGSIIGHEAAHFTLAKITNIPIKQVSLGFGDSLVNLRHNHIDYHIRILPLGGFVELDTSTFATNHIKAILILLSGPVVNFIFFLVTCYYLFNRFNRRGFFFKIDRHYFYQIENQTLSLDPSVPVPTAPGTPIDFSVTEKIRASVGYVKTLIGIPNSFNFLNILHQNTQSDLQKNKSSILGPIGIFQELYNRIGLGMEQTLLAFLSLNLSLAVLNSLPFPFLDGGKIILHTIMLTTGATLNVAIGLLMLGLFLLGIFIFTFFTFIYLAKKYLK